MQEYSGHYWVLNLPDQWNGHRGSESDSIFYQDGVGVVDITSIMNDVVAQDKDLRFYASEYLDKAAETTPIQLGDFSGFCLEYDEDGDFWWRAFVKSGHVLVFISYNCKNNEKRLELEAVQEILQSLSVKWDI
ncbi:hypothetical protein [Alkalimarinus coralli]|uniref:hypothetical protein n=1 Tax=Alkalimarinus coralli TaxID=2935863 RepID=UPI00202AEB79|nr:hypothetical protein [Alkalimarinus coralli]